MVEFAYNDNFLKSLPLEHKRQIEEKITAMGMPQTTTEESLDNWFMNFRNKEEKETALKIFLKIEYFSEYKIEKILALYKTKIIQYLTDQNKTLTDVLFVTPDGKADSADSHAYKLSKEWKLPREVFLSASEIDAKKSLDKPESSTWNIFLLITN